MTKLRTSTNTTTLPARNTTSLLWIRKKFKLRNQDRWTLKKVTCYMSDHQLTICTSLSHKKIRASLTSVYLTTHQMVTRVRLPISKKLVRPWKTTLAVVLPSSNITRLQKLQCQKISHSMRSTTGDHLLDFYPTYFLSSGYLIRHARTGTFINFVMKLLLSPFQ